MAEPKKVRLKPIQFNTTEKGQDDFKLFLWQLYELGLLKQKPSEMVPQELILTITDAEVITDYTYW